jgi:hypothetical protein
MLVLGTMGGLILMGNTATIDTGDMNKHLHVFCASRFFIITFAAQIYNAVLCTWLSTKTTKLPKWNLYLKYFILGMLVLQAIDSSIKESSDANSDKSKFLEWTLTATIISMFVSIGLDSRQF